MHRISHNIPTCTCMVRTKFVLSMNNQRTIQQLLVGKGKHKIMDYNVHQTAWLLQCHYWTTMCTKQPGYCNATTGLQHAPNSLVIAMPLLDYNMHQTAWLLQCHYYTENCNFCGTRSGRFYSLQSANLLFLFYLAFILPNSV